MTGYPLGHSYSKAFFTEKFREEGLRAEYLNFPLEALDREAIVKLIEETPELRGLNVTAPHKRRAYALADRRTPEAEACGAANTLRFRRGESDNARDLIIEAHNTDIEGFREAIRPYLGVAGQRKALICGTGGAAEAVRVALEKEGIKCIFVSRHPERHSNAIGYDSVKNCIGPKDVIVNATPLGTYPDTNSCPPLPYEALGSGNLCADLVYNPAETLFMKRCASQGATTFNGRAMLEKQALASYKFWNQSSKV